MAGPLPILHLQFRRNSLHSEQADHWPHQRQTLHPEFGTATDETTSAISDMHQAVPATAVAPDAEILAGATTDETGSPTSDMPQAGSSSELNAQVAARGQNKGAVLTDKRIDNAGRWVSPLYFIVAFLLALLVQLLMPALIAFFQR